MFRTTPIPIFILLGISKDFILDHKINGLSKNDFILAAKCAAV